MRDPLIYVALYRFSSNIPNIMALNGCTWFVTQTNLTYFYVSCVGTEPLSFYLINGVLNFNVAFVLALVSLPLVVSIMSLYAVWTNTFNFYLSEKQLKSCWLWHFWYFYWTDSLFPSHGWRPSNFYMDCSVHFITSYTVI